MITFTLPPDAFDNGYSPVQPDPTKAHMFPDGSFAPWVYHNDYIGPRMDCPAILRAPDADFAYLTKYDLPARPLDPYEALTDLPSILTAAAPQIVTTAIGPAPVYAWGATPISGGGWSSGGGHTIIVQGDTIILIIRPDPNEPCGCTEYPDPQPSPVSIEAGTGALLVAALLMMRRIRRKRRG